MTIKNLFYSAFFLSVAMLATWTTLLSVHKPALLQSQKPSLPDAEMEDVTALIMNKEGQMTLKIETPYLVHYREHDRTDFTKPQLTIYRQSNEPWSITSHYAQATEGIESIRFWENVNIRHSADKTHPNTEINTATLTVHPNQKTAETKDLITMIQPDLTVNAIGMHANISTGDVVLLSQARGEYAPSS